MLKHRQIRIYGLVAGMLLSLLQSIASVNADEPLDVWPDFAPGETTRQVGEKLPSQAAEVPTVTRVIKITRPTFTVHVPAKPNGAAVVILPGGGFSKVVPDKEGTEAAQWLGKLGVTAFVVSYRTTEGNGVPGWIKPLQDAQRTMALIRSQAEKWNLNKDRIGLLGFSAGGQVAARLLSAQGKRTYERIDSVDDQSSRPDFALLIYPWNMYDSTRDQLAEGIVVPKDCPPTFLVHTDDDRSSSLGTTHFYAGLKRNGIASELHVYGNGGHGYGLRPVKDSQISTWTNHAAHWLGTQGVHRVSPSNAGKVQFQTRNLAGWLVNIRQELLENETAATDLALELLQKQLDEIVRVVPASAVTQLQKVPLYFSPEYPKTPPRAEYHPAAGWLRENGREPTMAKGVEFTNIRIFEAEARRMPNFALHELAHAYHDQALEGGFRNSDIDAAWQRAKASGDYDRVERQDSEGRKRVERAYALTTAQEFFAETTEAFFSRNDFFPYNSEELKRHDPETFRLLAKLWGVRQSN